jgi:plastocyanin
MPDGILLASMDDKTDRRGFLTAAAGATAAGVGVGTAAGQEDTDGASDVEVEDGVYEIEMRTDGSEYVFDPIGLHVEPGDTVRWVNVSGSHSATAYAEGNGGATQRRIPEGAEPWNSEIQTEPDATFEYTFEEEGTYDYFCIPHKTLGMVGRIVCGEPGGPAEESENPDIGGIQSGEYPSSEAIVENEVLAYPYEPSDTGGGGGGGGPGGLPISITQLGLGAIVIVGLAATGKVFADRYDNAKAALIVTSIVAVLLMAGVVMRLLAA